MRFHFPKRFLTLSIAALILGGTVALACQVPVFRYALERWEADRYQIVIQPGKSGQFSKTEKAAVEFLQKTENSEEFPANFFLNIQEAASEKSDAATLSLIYPQKVRGLEQSPIWSGAATVENAQKIISSPMRHAIVTQLLEGKSAVWILLESGDEKLDQAANDAVEAAISKAGEVLEIPEGVLTQADLLKEEPPAGIAIDPENILQSEVPLKIDFSIIRMKRDDPAETILLQMLVNLEADLGDFEKETLVFPVFGRGRILEPLIGRGINEDNVLDYAGYLCGACSCEVKDQNPGMDLLVSANWNAALEGSEVIIEKILPPLVGTAALTAIVKPDATVADSASPVVAALSVEPEASPEEVKKGMSPFKILAITITIIFLIIGAINSAILRKNDS